MNPEKRQQIDRMFHPRGWLCSEVQVRPILSVSYLESQVLECQVGWYPIMCARRAVPKMKCFRLELLTDVIVVFDLKAIVRTFEFIKATVVIFIIYWPAFQFISSLT